MNGTQWRLVGATTCWSALAVSGFGIDNPPVLYPDVIGVLSVLAGLSTLGLLLQPENGFIYRWGGTVAVGALTATFLSLVFGAFRANEPNVAWIVFALASITGLLAVLYAWWWLSEIKAWHTANRFTP